MKVITCFLFVLAVASTQAQSITHRNHVTIISRTVVRPEIPQAVQVEGISARVNIRGQMATTTLDIFLYNPSRAIQESEVVLPIPAGSILRKFSFLGNNPGATATLYTREEARRIYDSIVAKTKDPALLEFIGCDLVKSSVFPVPANGKQRLQLVWEQMLKADSGRMEYRLPRSEALDYQIPWSFEIDVDDPDISLYSPSHEMEKESQTRYISASSRNPGPFLLSITKSKKDEPAAHLIAYPDKSIGGGYFMLMVTPPKPGRDAKPIAREVTMVIDRSGSMAGEKMDQVKDAALQILEGLGSKERFNIITYNESVSAMSDESLVKNRSNGKTGRAYLDNLLVSGGTNIHDALLTALEQPDPPKGALPLVLFLTDGLPTVGEISEKKIRDAMELHNRARRRIFTIGVGEDVNTPLLNSISRNSRGVYNNILPGENIELKVASIFRKLGHPTLANPTLHSKQRSRLQDILPSPNQLPDVFGEEQLIVLGTYRGKKPLSFQLKAITPEGPRTFPFTFQLDEATYKNAYVSRLWASHKIGNLTEAIRNLEAHQASSDPRFKELVDEIVRLSTEFGILTEYTAFLATEGTDFSREEDLREVASTRFRERALMHRSGRGSVNQDYNTKAQIEKKSLNLTNSYWDKDMQKREFGQVNQMNNRAYYKQDNRWVDSKQLKAPSSARPKADRVVHIGSKEFNQVVDQLAETNQLGVMALKGERLVQVGDENILIQ
jgi:Ca-activated chloride channel family protein